jgi:hypothetical protein
LPEGVDSLLIPKQNASALHAKNAMLIPSLVLNMIMEAKLLEPAVLIPMLSTKFQEFDRPSPTGKVCSVLCPVLEFLWAFHHQLIPATT